MTGLTRRAFIGSLGMATLLAGCGGHAQNGSRSAEGSAAGSGTLPNEPSEAVTVGGWVINTEADVDLTEEEAAVFAAIDPALDVEFEPVSVLAMQVVAGFNYAYLVKETSTESVGSDVPDTHWAIAVVYQDLADACELISIKAIDVLDIPMTDEAPEDGLTGAWAVCEKEDAPLLPAEAQEAFGLATEGYASATLHPIATLASQVVAGMNYLILCEGTSAASGSLPQLYAATIYAALDGAAEPTSLSPIDLYAYV